MVELEKISPFPVKRFDRQGLSMAYIDEGRGSPVVMLHGNPTWSYMYRNLIAALSPDHRCIVPDHIGCGLSDKPEIGGYRYTLASRVEDLERLLEHLGVCDDITLVAHDWGGMIAFVYAVCHPERIRRIVAANTAAFPLPKGKRLPIELRLCRLPILGEILVRGMNLFCRQAASRCTVKPLPEPVREALLAPYDCWERRVAIHQFVADIPLRPADRSYGLVQSTSESLGRLAATPLLVLWGMHDFVFDHAFLAEWRLRFPQADFKTFDQAGHWVFEDAGPECIAAIRDFLSGHS